MIPHCLVGGQLSFPAGSVAASSFGHGYTEPTHAERDRMDVNASDLGSIHASNQAYVNDETPNPRLEYPTHAQIRGS
jgi:hypothetical protein